jgi:hypothetical protein
MSDERGVIEVNGIKEYRYFAGGESRTAENRKLFDVYRPSAAKAFPAWSQSTLAIRTSLFFKAGGEPQ